MHYKPSPRQLAKAARIEQWRALKEAPEKRLLDIEQRLHGTIIRPGDPDYDKERQGGNPAYQRYPDVIFRCDAIDDVAEALAYARENALPVVCRSGGHSYATYCSKTAGVVINVSALNDVSIEPEARRARVGPGAQFDKLDRFLRRYGLHVPSPGGPSVAVAGFMQGGGYGFTSRQFGMNCDNVLAVRLMLADGREVVASALENPELFWAIRGGTGSNFGVVLEVTYQLHALADLWGFRLQWKVEDAARVLHALQEGYTLAAPDELGYLAGLVVDPTTQEPVVVMMGLFNGTAEQGRSVLAPLLKVASAPFVVDRTGPYHELNTYVLTHPYAIPVEQEPRPFIIQSRYFARPASLQDWEKVVEAYGRPPPDASNFVCIEPYGGAIRRYPAGGNAFIHRDVLLDCFTSAFWSTRSGEEAAITWMNRLMNDLLGHVGKRAYQNYPTPRLPEFQDAYWDEETLKRLSRVKKDYDPDNLFRYEQSIPI
ncbi:FAD-binding oxidoreductase [Myxococcus sp. RHSTA-1-4]|uniref:FAD-binding oxidoreductase n=1 Tax=Myxococcus sp. RHSTA-1-4 TaxID=2874601 RepID=UPI001CBE75D3|nr:FAD-binding oxidoreductase [Myxococcus sp. RHSTA-1-4]MBZ4423298.1 FAD-binding oxidoreductase [Myxococcus sp. RHSTA-1-4]